MGLRCVPNRRHGVWACSQIKINVFPNRPIEVAPVGWIVKSSSLVAPGELLTTRRSAVSSDDHRTLG